MAKQKLIVEGLSISINKEGYVSLTDIAKQKNDEPRFIVRNWLRNTGTIKYLHKWESVHYPNNSNRADIGTVLSLSADNSFSMTPSQWITLVAAKGIVSKSGRYGGTFAHPDIALNFCYWLSPEFQVYFYKEFQRLKNDEAVRLGLTFDLRREIAKTNYSIQTDAIEKLLTDKTRSDEYKDNYKGNPYASEADLLNVVIFGITAQSWRAANPNKKGNIRDYATIDELLLLLNMESLNATMISWEYPQKMRAEILKVESDRQLPIIKKNKAVKRIKSQEKKQLK